jgi:hypothetical protein
MSGPRPFNRSWKLWQVAGAGFVVGVFLHACAFMVILDDGGGGSAEVSSGGSEPANQPAPTATRIPDRTNCDDIRGTDYRSDTEREWFLRNCQ